MALAALVLVVFGAYDSYPISATNAIFELRFLMVNLSIGLKLRMGLDDATATLQ